MATFVTFTCGSKACALARDDVSRVAPLPRLARPPVSAPVVAGFLNLAGEPLAVIDAAQLWGLSAAPSADPLYRHVVIVRGRLGLLVDRVTDVRALDLAGASAPGADASLNGCVALIVEASSGPIFVLDADRFLTEAESERVAQLTALERARLAQWATP